MANNKSVKKKEEVRDANVDAWLKKFAYFLLEQVKYKEKSRL